MEEKRINRESRIARSKRRRKQQLRRRLLMGFMAAFAIVLVAGVSAYRGKKDQEERAARASEVEAQNKASEKSQEIKANTLKEEATNDETEEERLKRVKKEAEKNNYPDDVIELLSKNPETVDFVEDYKELKDEPCAESIGDDYVEGEIPQLLQWDKRWGYQTYGTSVIAASGCGPTCVSMVLIGLTGDPEITPAVIADFSMKKGSIDKENNTYWTLMVEAANEWNIDCVEGTFTEEEVKTALEAGQPIICSVGPGDFTKIGHFIVLTGYSDGKVTVHDPFNQKNSEKEWTYKDIEDQIAEMWIYSKK